MVHTKYEYVKFATENITEETFQWFVDILSYLQFIIVYMVSTEKFQRGKVHTAKVKNHKDNRHIYL